MEINSTQAIPHFAKTRTVVKLIPGISERYLRKLIHENKAPGFYSGRDFLINVPALVAYLDKQGGEQT